MWELKQGDCIEQLKTLPEKSIQIKERMSELQPRLFYEGVQ